MKVQKLGEKDIFNAHGYAVIYDNDGKKIAKVDALPNTLSKAVQTIGASQIGCILDKLMNVYYTAADCVSSNYRNGISTI